MSLIVPVQTLVNGTMTGTTVIASSPVDLLTESIHAIEIAWTGTPNGSFKVLGSVTGTNYFDLGVTIADAAGSASTRLASLTGVSVRWVKLQYTNATSTGTLNVWAMAKNA